MRESGYGFDLGLLYTDCVFHMVGEVGYNESPN